MTVGAVAALCCCTPGLYTLLHRHGSPKILVTRNGTAGPNRWRGGCVLRDRQYVLALLEEDGMKDQALTGTPLNSHMQTNVHALLFGCPYCGAKPGERCQGAESYPDGYSDTLHKDREGELQRRLDAATAGLTQAQAAAVRSLFVNPPTAEERRAVMKVLLWSEHR